MNIIKYTEDQLNELIRMLNTVSVVGVDNIRAMSIVFQIIQSGQLEVDIESGE